MLVVEAIPKFGLGETHGFWRFVPTESGSAATPAEIGGLDSNDCTVGLMTDGLSFEGLLDIEATTHLSAISADKMCGRETSNSSSAVLSSSLAVVVFGSCIVAS